MIKGSCLCGAVKYEISGDINDIVHCHCQTCRKAHGSAFSSVAAVKDSDFNLINDHKLKSYQSSAGKLRYFCDNCGSQIYAKRESTAHVILRLGTLDSDINASETAHIWVSQKASWYNIQSRIIEHDQFEA